MIIRKYQTTDCKNLAELFYNTVHFINIQDYTKEQLDAWADGNISIKEWDKSFLSNFTIVAIKNDIIAGFGDIDKTGYLNRLYVHKNYQNQKIATEICDKLESAFNIKTVKTHSSITAKPFFEKRGYVVLKKQQVERNRIFLTNFVMEKQMDKIYH